MKKKIISLFLAVVMIVGMVPFTAMPAMAETVGETHMLTFTDAYEKRNVVHGECLPVEDFPNPDHTLKNYLSLGWQYEKDGKMYFFNESVPVTEDLTLTYCQMSVEEASGYPDKTEITTSDKASLTSLSGIYTVSVGSDIVIDNRCAVIGFAVIILPDGCNITFSKGINVTEYRKLFIIAPDGAKGTGKLTATGGNEYIAGIGGDKDATGGTVNIYGGTVTATGGEYGAGIGGGFHGNGGTVSIYGGTVTATGGFRAAGIGGGSSGNGGIVSVSGGTVIATGGDNGAGIGGGRKGNGGTVNIYGGMVTVNGGYDAPGIGGGGYGAGGGTLRISGGIVRAAGKTAFGGDVTVRSNMTAYDITNGEENAPMTSEDTSAAKILVMPTAYDYLAVERNAYIDTGYKPTNNTRVVMNVDVKGGREYWFGVWDTDYNRSAFAFGNDMTGIYTGYGDEGGTYGQAVSNGYHTVELDKNSVKVDGNSINTHGAAKFQLNNTLYLFAQNRAGEATVHADQSAVIYCYGCEIYEGDTLVRKFVPGKSSSGASGLWDVVNGVFYDNQYESKEHYAGMDVWYHDGVVETVSNQPTCTEDGFSTYYKKSGKYYKDAECTDEITDLSVWLSKTVGNGGGILPALGHDWDGSLEKHTCSRCKLEETHIDANDDKVCDVCGNDLLTSRDVVYLNKIVNETTGRVTTEETHYTGNAYTVFRSGNVWGESGETTWYILDNDVTLDNRPEVKGDVRLILRNGKTLTANKGITVEEGNSLSIFAQTDDESKMGTLRITALDGETAIGGIKGNDGLRYDGPSPSTQDQWVDGSYGSAGGIVRFYGGKSVLSSTNAATVGGGKGGDAGYLPHRGGTGGKGGAGGSVYFYGGRQTLSATNASAISGGNGGKGSMGGKNGTNGANATVTFYGSLLMKAGDDAESAVATDSYNGQKYLLVSPATEYYEYNPSTKQFERKFTDIIPTKIESFDDYLHLYGDWYIVSGNVTVESLRFYNDTHIILANGALLTATDGITVMNGKNITFYAQTEDYDKMGQVVVPGASNGAPGIGSTRQGECGDITINGGVFYVMQGGMNAAGIGAGADGKCGTITINGGKVFATAGDYGAGIGSGSKMDDGYENTCAGVVINGGVIRAIGKDGAEDIGAGCGSNKVDLTVADGVSVKKEDTRTYVNIEHYPETQPSCADGHKEYFKNLVNGKYYTTDTLEPESIIEDIDAWLAGEGKNGDGNGNHKDTNEDGYCDTCGTLAKVDIYYHITGTPTYIGEYKAGEKLADSITETVKSKIYFTFGDFVELSGHLDSSGNFIKSTDLVPFGIERMDIYAVLEYKETEPSCTNNGHKVYYENTHDKLFYGNALCNASIGDASALAEWLSDENGGLNGAAKGHTDKNGDGRCDRCTLLLVESFSEEKSTCVKYGHKAYYKKIGTEIYYEDIACKKIIGSYNQLQTWLSGSGLGRLPLAEHNLKEDGTCEFCGRVLTKYYEYRGGNFELKGIIPDRQIVASSTDLSLTEGWYLIDGSVTVTYRITVSGNVHIILANYSELTAKNGIGIAEGGSLTVYAQTLDTSRLGKITVPYAPDGCAGIGSGENVTFNGITINGGVISVTGGIAGAGIGGGRNGDCDNINIYGGVVTANGGDGGAGIGSGFQGSCEGIRIYDGVIIANGGKNAAGIGSGYEGTCGDIVINGGIIKSTGGENAEDIGSGNKGTCGTVSYGDNPHTNDGSEWVNLEYIAYKAATCTEAGVKEAYKNRLDGNYYSAFPFTSADLIDITIPAMGHSDTNLDGKCDHCETVFTSEEIKCDGISLTLDSDIYINFYMQLTEEALANGKMVFTIGNRTVEGVTVKQNAKNGRYYFACPLNALEMAETVTATFTYGSTTYTQKYSVKQYIETILNDKDEQGNDYSDEMKLLARKIANYGYYAQLYLESIHTNVTIGGENGYKEMLSDFKTGLNTENALELTDGFTVSPNTANLTLYGRTVYFDSATALNFYVTTKDGNAPTATCDKGKNVEVKLYKDKTYIVSVKDISATELGEQYTVVVGEGADTMTLKGSVLDYCAAVMNAHRNKTADKDVRAVNAMAAFYEYYEAAKAYVSATSK